MTNFQVGGSEQTAETCVTPQGSAPNMWERYLRKGPKSVSPSVGELLAHKWCPRGHRASSEPHLGCHRDPSSAKQRSQSFLPGIWAGVSFFFFFYLRALLSTAEWLGWGRCASRTFHSAGGGLSITRCVTPFYRAGGGGGDAPSGKRKRVRRRRRRRCSLSSSAKTFSACCREHGPRERTGAATIALPLDGLEAHLAKSIFSVMPAVYFVLNGYWLKYKICTYSVSGTQPPALPAIFSIYQATETCCFSCTFSRPPQPHRWLIRWREEVAGTLGLLLPWLLLFSALSWHVWVSAKERFEHNFPAPTGAFHSETCIKDR